MAYPYVIRLDILSKQVLDLFVQVTSSCRTIPAIPGNDIFSYVEDFLQRFTLWAGNIGAFYEPESEDSLEFRVRAAPILRNHFSELLVDAREDLEELQSLLQDHAERPSSSDSALGFEVACNGLIDTLNETLRGLFRTSAVARRTVTHDKYAVAQKEIDASEVTSETIDYDLIGEIFPRLDSPERNWLLKKLAKANTLRRRYLRFCQNHQKIEGQADSRRVEGFRAQQKGWRTPEEHDEEHTNVLPQVRKWTTGATDSATLESLQVEESDVDSQGSSISTSSDANIPERYPVLDLGYASYERDGFICPCCRNKIRCASQHEWKKHIFSDIKAYLCLDEQCETVLFEDSHSWLHHYQNAHLARKVCPYCDERQEFHELELLKSHMREYHATRFQEHQLAKICELCDEIPDTIPASSCPFCDWSSILTIDKGDQTQGSQPMVSLERFERHVSIHMEHAASAIFATGSRSAENNPRKVKSASEPERVWSRSQACTECRRSLKKCNKENPCARCAHHGYSCVYPTPTQPGNYYPRKQARTSGIEDHTGLRPFGLSWNLDAFDTPDKPRIVKACTKCKQRKIRCRGGHDGCVPCSRAKIQCSLSSSHRNEGWDSTVTRQFHSSENIAIPAISASLPQNPRKKIVSTQACYKCRVLKMKCDGNQPCNFCAEFGYECRIAPVVNHEMPGRTTPPLSPTRLDEANKTPIESAENLVVVSSGNIISKKIILDGQSTSDPALGALESVRDLSEDDQFLVQLKEDENLRWEDISTRFQTEKGRFFPIRALKMRYHLLRERRTWEEQDHSRRSQQMDARHDVSSQTQDHFVPTNLGSINENIEAQEFRDDEASATILATG